MTTVADFRFILFLLLILPIDANGNIVQTGTKTGESSFQCGTRLVLTCQINVYLKSMFWKNDTSLTPLAECVIDSCFVQSTVAGLYEISANISIGIFNLTIIEVTFENNGTNYICGDGSPKGSSLVIVKDYEPTINETISGIIEVSSGCIDQSTEVEFMWEKVKTDGAETESDYDPPNITQSNTTCTGDTNCEPTHFVKQTRSIRTVPGSSDDYRLRAVLCYDGFCVKSYLTKQRYKIEDEGTCNCTCKIQCDIVCILLLVIGICISIYVIVGCLLLYVMLRRTEEEDNTEDKWSKSTQEKLLHRFSAVLWVVIASLFICLVILCNCKDCEDCEDTCDCCVGLPLGIVFGILFFIHLVLWFILLCVLYNRTGKWDNEGEIHFKTKVEKVRMKFSTIPLVGLFPVCGWLIRIYCCEKCTVHDEQLTTDEKNQQLSSTTKPNLANPKTVETGKQSSNTDRKERKKEQEKIHKFVDKEIGLGEKADQVSESDVIIVKPSGTDTVKHSRSSKSGENSTKRKTKAGSEIKTSKHNSQKEKIAFQNSGTKQLSQNNGNVITSSQEHNNEHKKNMADSPNLVSYSEETSQRKMYVTKTQTGYENNPGSKDDVKRETNKSRKSEVESKHPLNTSMVSSEAHTGTMDLTETKTGSENKPGSKDDVKHEKKKSRKAKDENKNPQNTNMVSAEAHTGNIDVTTTGSEDKLGSSDNDNPSNFSMPGKALPRRKVSRKEIDDNKNPRNTKPGSADSHNGSETMKRALSANFHDDEDATTTVSIDSTTKM